MPKPIKKRQVMFVFSEQDSANFDAIRAHFPNEFTMPSGKTNSTLVFRRALQLAADLLSKKGRK